MLAVVAVATAPTAAAVAPPVVEAMPAHVTADALPTVQIDGVVWDQEIVGNTVYVVGDFDKARPAGAPPGSNQTPRSNVLAYNLTTGALIPGFVANPNSQVKTVTQVARRLAHLHRRAVHHGERQSTGTGSPPSTPPRVRSSPRSTPSPTTPSTTSSSRTPPSTPVGRSTGRPRRRADPVEAGRLRRPPTAHCCPGPRRERRPCETMLMSPDGSRLFVGRSLPHLNGQAPTAWARSTRHRRAHPVGRQPVVIGVGGPTARSSTSDRRHVDLRQRLHLRTHYREPRGRLQGRPHHRRDPVGGGLPRRHVPVRPDERLRLHGVTRPLLRQRRWASRRATTRTTQWGEYKRHALSFKDEAGRHAPSRQLELPQPRRATGPVARDLVPGVAESAPSPGQGQATWAVEGNGQYVVYGGEFTPGERQRTSRAWCGSPSRRSRRNEGPRLSGDAFPIKVVSRGRSGARVAPGQLRPGRRRAHLRDPAQRRDRAHHHRGVDLLGPADGAASSTPG